MAADLRPKKSLGQHWLHDEDVLADMAELSNACQGDTIIEVGPGLGTLTKVLLESGAHVTAVEYDKALFDNLSGRKQELFGKNSDSLTLVNEDILEYRFDQIVGSYKVVANIPYYLTSNLIRVLSESDNQPEVITLLIQKEVAERLCAAPGDMSLLSVWAQMYYACELGPVVPAALFTPPPKVDSQIVCMKKLSAPVFGAVDKKALARVIKAGFSNKRKTLHNSLSGGLHFSKPQTRELLEKAGISVNARPQELALAEWVKLADLYSSHA